MSRAKMRPKNAFVGRDFTILRAHQNHGPRLTYGPRSVAYSLGSYAHGTHVNGPMKRYQK